MSRKILYIVIIIGIILLIAVFLLPFFLKNQNGESMTVAEVAREFWPFGRPTVPEPSVVSDQDDTNQTATSTENQVQIDENFPILRQITTVPVSGSVIFSKNREYIDENRIRKTITEYFVRFMERGNGHISETKINSLDIQKVSNTSVPQIYEATFSNLGDTFNGRYLASNMDDIGTLIGIIGDIDTASSTASSTPSNETFLKEVKIKNLDRNIIEISYLPSKTKSLYLLNDDATDGSKIILSNFDGSNKKQILASPLREWLLYFMEENRAVIATKPSGTVLGYSYILNLTNGSQTKLIGDILGLTILPSRNLSYLLVGSGGDIISMSIIKVGDQSPVSTYNTLPEKCVWSKKNNLIVYCAIPSYIPPVLYPDSWYQGLMSFNDQIWKIDVNERSARVIATPEILANTSIDAINLDISAEENYLTFINKKDLTLWGLILEPSVSTATSTPSN